MDSEDNIKQRRLISDIAIDAGIARWKSKEERRGEADKFAGFFTERFGRQNANEIGK